MKCKREQRLYPAILTEQVWSIRDLSYMQPKDLALFRITNVFHVFFFFFFLTFICRFWRLHHRHCPRIMNFVSPLGNSVLSRWVHLCRSGSQQDSLYILPTGAASNIIMFIPDQLFDTAVFSEIPSSLIYSWRHISKD